MKAFAAMLLTAALAAQQGAADAFKVSATPSPTGQGDVFAVEADCRHVSCLDALRDLAGAMNWNLDVESTPLETDLSYQSVDLNLKDQDPRMVAHLIAVAGGADVIFQDPEPVQGSRTVLHVVRVPDPSTASGRQRMRAIAGQWYRSFLRDELEHDPLVAREAVEVRMNLGQLLVDSGDLANAVGCFVEVFEARPNDRVADAILKIAECHLDIARTQPDRASRTEHFAEAERWARELLERMPSSPGIARATILLGQALLGLAKTEPDGDRARAMAEACQTELRARVIRLIDSVEMLDVWLLAGESQLMLGQPDRVYQTMLTLRESAYFDDLSPEQYRYYHFLLGYGALGVGKTELAMRSLEWFLLHAEGDERAGVAHVLLAESYLAQGRLLQARAASIEARRRYLGTLSPEWRQRCLEAWARTALALGDKERAFTELEQMIARGEEPELALFLCDQLLADRQWARAMAVIDDLLPREGPIGDRARYKVVVALYRQAVASKNVEDFPPQAIEYAVRIKDPELAEKVATMIGDAYTSLDRLEQAADAYRGILR